MTSVEDSNGNVATIERGVNGEPTAIVGAYGARTVVTLNSDGYLASVPRHRTAEPLATRITEI